MKNNNYALFYKENIYDIWHSKRPELPVSEWENYAKEQGYITYHISDFKTFDAWHLHLTTNVVRFDNKYYLPEEEIPYPKYETDYIEKMEVSMEWEDEKNFFYKDYDEVYQGIDYLWTLLNVDFSSSDKTLSKVVVYAESFISDIPKFLDELQQKKHAIHHNDELSPFKWLAWIQDDKIRLIQQCYCYLKVKKDFDILINKDEFFNFCNGMLQNMQEYADKHLRIYQDYTLKKYGKLCEKSIPYPDTVPLNLGKFEIKTNPETRDESDFEEYNKTKDELWTTVYTNLKLGDKTEEVVLIAEDFAEGFPFFLQELKNIENAVYDDYKYTETKLHAWIKGDNVRLFYQDYSDAEQEVIFDILVDKNWFFNTAEMLIEQMKELAISEAERYKEYLKAKGGECQKEQ